MKSFFKSFLAALLALFVFSIVGVLILIGLAATLSMDEPVDVPSNAVIVLDLGDNFTEKEVSDPFAEIMRQGAGKVPTLSTIIGLIQHAKKDSNIKGIYIKCQQNSNGYAASEEIRKALVDFKKSNKFIVAYKSEIPYFNYSNPVKHFYDQMTQNVIVLITRNKNRLLKEILESKELMILLAYSTRRDLDEKEKSKVKKQLLDICKSIPSLTIFLLPGGSLLLPILIKFIPKLLPSSFNENLDHE